MLFARNFYGGTGNGDIIDKQNQILAAIGALSTSGTEKISAVSADGGTLTLIRGDDYIGIDIGWKSIIPDQWDLFNKTVLFGLSYGSTTLQAPGTIVSGTDEQLISVQLTSVQTSGLPVTNVGAFDVQTYDTVTETYRTIIRGSIRVLESFTDPPILIE